MAINMFKLNDDKTEFIIFETCQQLRKIDHITIGMSSENIVPIEHVRNLGFFMDKLFKNTTHINKLYSSLCHQLKNIQNIRGKLDFEAAKTVVQALILSKLDYFNSLSVETPECHLSWLQYIQNMTCRVVWNLRKYDHVTASMKSLHWLRVWECISYKIACLVHQCKVRSAPQYLVDLLPIAAHNHSLRSSTSGNLQTAKCKTSLAKEGSFCSPGLKIWNSIPPNIWAEKSRDSFRKNLKTSLWVVISYIDDPLPIIPHLILLVSLLQIFIYVYNILEWYCQYRML